MNQLPLNPAAVARALAAVAFFLVLASIAGQLSTYLFGHGHLKGLVPLFYLNYEENIPAYFAVLMLLMAALVLAAITWLNHRARAPHTSKWALLSAGFLFMAYDEAFSVHEELISPVSELLGDEELGIFYYAWVVPGLALVGLLALFYLRFLLALGAATRLRFIGAAGLYLGGAIGVELFEGYYAERYLVDDEENFTYSMIVTVEESLELAGLIVFIWALLKYCAERWPEVQLRFGSD